LKDAPPEVMGKLTDTRSSGRADIPKIKRGTARARVRLPVSSNGLKGMPVLSYAYGLDMIREVIPNLEDIRRFDACMVVSQTEVAPATLQRQSEYDGDGKYSAIDCRNLVLFAWTRTPDQIVFEDWPRLLELYGKLAEKFESSIPIFDIGSGREKLARLSIALAIRTYSIHPDDPKGETVFVRRAHIEYIASWLNKIYTTRAFGYDRFSAAIKKQNSLESPETIVVEICKLPFPKQAVERMLQANDIQFRDLCDWTTFDRQQASQFLSLLVRSNAIIRDTASSYRKMTAFTELLQRLLVDPQIREVSEPPAYLKGAM
jgi:hypothetical protein